MNSYKIEVTVKHIDNLQSLLQEAYDNGAYGSFRFTQHGDKVKIVFDRDYLTDAEYIEPRLSYGRTLQQAVCEQVADEFEELGDTALAPVVEALRKTGVAVFLEDDEPSICASCNGSGEGMYDGTRCSRCGGSGEERGDDEEDSSHWDDVRDAQREEQS